MGMVMDGWRPIESVLGVLVTSLIMPPHGVGRRGLEPHRTEPVMHGQYRGGMCLLCVLCGSLCCVWEVFLLRVGCWAF
jgi:hypothetical protein